MGAILEPAESLPVRHWVCVDSTSGCVVTFLPGSLPAASPLPHFLVPLLNAAIPASGWRIRLALPEAACFATKVLAADSSATCGDSCVPTLVTV